MIKNYKKGFTLIELLVVIAIIGILASVVLISTSKTRAQGSDASIKANLATMKLQAEMINNQYGCFSNDCDGGTFTPPATCSDGILNGAETAIDVGDPACSSSTLDICSGVDALATKAFTAASKASAADATDISCKVSTNNQSFAVSMPLRSEPTQFWCVDSSGYADVSTTIVASDNGICEE
jgi:prepilin-type N-terminal cleavage/methylation domain-containing protein